MNTSFTSYRPSAIRLTPRIPALQAGSANVVDVLYRIEGPEKPEHLPRRPRLNLAFVIDRSGSMSGEPLHQAKRCVSQFISQLEDEDSIAVIAYDAKVDIFLPSQQAASRDLAFQAINRIESRGMTNLHLGWETGAMELKKFAAPDVISRVLLLSDGQANKGLQDPAQIGEACNRMAHASISTSTYGLGMQFNENLMTLMAEQGQGQAYYGETAEDLMGPFQEEFDLLTSVYARNVRLAIDCPDGITAEVLNTYTGKQRKVLPDLAFGAEVWVMIRFHVEAAYSGRGAGEPILLGECQLTANDMNGQPLVIDPSECWLPSTTAEDYQQLQADELVTRRLGEVIAARFQTEARLAAEKGDWQEVDRLLDEARLVARENPWVEAILDILAGFARQRDYERFSKESRYASRSLSTRYASLGEDLFELRPDSEPTSFTSRKTRQGKTSGRSSEQNG